MQIYHFFNFLTRNKELIGVLNTLSSSLQGVGMIINYFFFTCDSKARDITLGILYGCKAMQEAIAIVFAFSNRKVKVKGLNDAKYIAASVYISSIVLAVIFVATYSLIDFVNIFAALFASGFLLGTSVILVLAFVPNVSLAEHTIKSLPSLQMTELFFIFNSIAKLMIATLAKQLLMVIFFSRWLACTMIHMEKLSLRTVTRLVENY